MVSKANNLLTVCRQIYEEARPIQAQVATLSLVRIDALTRLSRYPDEVYLSKIQHAFAYTNAFNSDAAAFDVLRLPALKKLAIEGVTDMHSAWKTWFAFRGDEVNERIIDDVKEELGPVQSAVTVEGGCTGQSDTDAILTYREKAMEQQPGLVIDFLRPCSWWPKEDASQDQQTVIKYVKYSICCISHSD